MSRNCWTSRGPQTVPGISYQVNKLRRVVSFLTRSQPAYRRCCSLLVIFSIPEDALTALWGQHPTTTPASQPNPYLVYCSSTVLPHTCRAEFDSCLKELADTQGLPPLSTANDIFGLFDGTKGGILHFRDLAAGLAVLCDGCMALSVLRACRLYKGADGGMGFAEISAFTTSIFKVRLRLQLWPDLLFRCHRVVIGRFLQYVFKSSDFINSIPG